MKTVNIPINKFSVESVIREINKHAEGKILVGAFFNNTSLLGGTLEIHTKEPVVETIVRIKKKPGASSIYRGVFKKDGKWVAAIGKGNKKIWLGYHDSELLAAKAYDKAAKELHGDKAILNFE